MSFVPHYVGESRLCFTGPYMDHFFKNESGPYRAASRVTTTSTSWTFQNAHFSNLHTSVTEGYYDLLKFTLCILHG